MNQSTDFPDEQEVPLSMREEKNLPLEVFHARGVPTFHPAEADPFIRQKQTLAFRQEALQKCVITLIGAGGLNSWVGLALARSGAQRLVIVDEDRIDRTNLPRQLYFPDDLGKPKGGRLARNLAPHAVDNSDLVGINLRLEDALEAFTLPADLLVVGVDRNDCRLQATRLARRRRIPAVFTLLSQDSMRVHCFLQGPDVHDPCLWCALPNLDPEGIMACVPSQIASCLLAAGLAVFFVFRGLMGWPDLVESFNFRETDLLGINPDRTGQVEQRKDCPVCSPFLKENRR